MLNDMASMAAKVLWHAIPAVEFLAAIQCCRRCDEDIGQTSALRSPMILLGSQAGISGQSVTSAFTLERCLWLQNNGELAAAEALCLRLLDFGAASKERAKALLREIRSMQVPRHPTSLISAACTHLSMQLVCRRKLPLGRK